MINPSKSFLLIFAATFTLISCSNNKKENEPVWSDLPTVTTLSSLQQTEFVATMQDTIYPNKNAIYAPAFLFAWDKVKQQLASPIITSTSNSVQFKLLNQSSTHQHSLLDSEYTASAQIIDGVIIAKAFFNKTLPFATKMQVLQAPILFGKTTVSAFGMNHYDKDIAKSVVVMYYKNDDHFILQLIPKDDQHQVILVKGLNACQTLQDAVALTNKWIVETRSTEQPHQYSLTEKDIFSIPVIKFNIATDYQTINRQAFSTADNKKHIVQEAIQRTGFIFNENGAVVESKATVVVDSVAPRPIAIPRKLVFDRPFLIIIKRAAEANPYFVMQVANAELLTKK